MRFPKCSKTPAARFFQEIEYIHNNFKVKVQCFAGFDVEILYIAQKLGYKIKEVPVECYTLKPEGKSGKGFNRRSHRPIKNKMKDLRGEYIWKNFQFQFSIFNWTIWIFVSAVGLFLIPLPRSILINIIQVVGLAVIEKYFQHIGYFQRPLSSGLFTGIILLLFFFYLMVLKTLRRGRWKKELWSIIILVNRNFSLFL